MQDRVGSLVGGKYRLLRRLGSGGMGEVYEARHEGTGGAVAVKVMRRELAGRSAAETRFDREARVAGRIGHDGICEVLDVGRTEDGLPYLVMPCLRGRSLADLLAREGRLPVRRAVDIAEQVLAALEAAHAAGILHRDLKPANVFLTRMGERDDFVKLLDFGVAGLLGDQGADNRPTRDGGLVGTAHYMSPEQVRGRLALDRRADLYAVGVLLYEMLTGRTPFQGRSDTEVLSAILLDAFPPPRALRPEIPARLEAEILRALSRDREARHADAGSLRRALRGALDGADAGVAAASQAAGVPEPGPREPSGATAAVVGDSTLDGTSGGAVTFRPAGMDGPSPRDPRGRARWKAVAALVALAALGTAALAAALLARRDGPPAAASSLADPASGELGPAERATACAEVGEHLWRLADEACRAGRQAELCLVLAEMDAKLGVAWTAPGPAALVCGSSGGRTLRLPVRERFSADLRSWCETGRIGPVFASRWSRRGIDCNREATRIEDVRRCWGL